MQDEPWGVVDWSAIPGPPHYRPDRVVSAFRAMLSPETGDRDDPATMMRSAAGNDHGGTIYPAGVVATRVMLEIIDRHPGPPRRAALAVLLDWWVFDPEPGCETYADQDGTTVDVVATIQDAVLAASPMIERVASGTDDAVAARMAAELLVCARNGWGSFTYDGAVHHRWED